MCKCKQNDLVHLGQKLEYCLQFSGRTVETASMKLAEEVGEVMEAVFSTSLLNKEKRYKQIPDSAVVEECVDVILCAISVIRLKNPAFSMQNVLKLLERKLDKWIITQGWIMPKGFGPSELNLNIYNNDQPDPSSDTVSQAFPHPMHRGVYLGGNLFTDEYGRLQQMIPPKNGNVQPSPSSNSATQVPLANGNPYTGTDMSFMLEYLFQRVRKLHTVGPVYSEIQKIMRACLGYTEYFDAHRQWWEHNQATMKIHASYDEDFVSFVESHYATFGKGTKHNL